MSEEKELPSGWSKCSIYDIAKWGAGGTPKSTESRFYGGDIPWLIIGDLNDGFVSDSEKTITLEGLRNSTAKLIEPFNVLIAMYGSIGKLGVNTIPVTTNQAIAFTEKIYGNISYKYLYIFLFYLRPRLNKLGKGATQKNISQTVLKEIEICIPPLSEQQRIVAKIEELFSSLDKGIESLKHAQTQLKIYRQAVLKWAFEGKLTESWRQQNNLPSSLDILNEIKNNKDCQCTMQKKNNKEMFFFTQEELQSLPELLKGWVWVKIDALAENQKNSVKAGPFGSSLKKETYVSDGYKIYGQEQVISGNASCGDYYIDIMKFHELSSCCVKPFDILISLVGTIGKVLILPENCKAGIINPRLIKISLNRDLYQPAFFKYFFESAFLNQLYQQKAHGATMDVLNLEIIRSLPFPLCSRIEQEKVIQEIESRLSVCDKLEESIEQSLLQAESLRQSILKKAFEGKLVPQDPYDEPASVLLERIRAERNADIPVKKTRKSKEAK